MQTVLNISGVFVGPLRLFLLFPCFLILYRMIAYNPQGRSQIDFAFVGLTRNLSLLLLVLFALILTRTYDVFTIFLIFLLVFGIELNKRLIGRRVSQGIPFILALSESIDKLFSYRLKELLVKAVPLKRFQIPELAAYVGIGVLAFVSRYVFMTDDLYTLSSLWLEDLDALKSVDQQIFSSSDLQLTGQPALIDLYSRITGISHEIALASFGFLEQMGLAVLLFWILGKLTDSKYIIPLAACVLYCLGFTLLPIDLTLMNKPSSDFLALILAIPYMALVIWRPHRLPKGADLMRLGLGTSLAISVTSLYISLLVVPLFLFWAWVFMPRARFSLPKLAGYHASAVLIVFIIFYVLGRINGYTLQEFLLSNLIQVHSYTYLPQLKLPLDQLLDIYLFSGLLAVVVTLFFYYRNRDKWAPHLIVFTSTLSILLLTRCDFYWLDRDMMMVSLPWLLSLMAGTIIGVLYQLFARLSDISPKVLAVPIGGIAIALITLNLPRAKPTLAVSSLRKSLLTVYDKLSQDHLPFSYSVVNQEYGELLARGTHHYTYYQDFIQNHLERDSRYQEVKDDKAYLKKRPEVVLPPSIFVFITRSDSGNVDYGLITPESYRTGIDELLEELQNKGREVRVVFEDQYLTVYEVVNEAKSSQLNDLMFDL